MQDNFITIEQAKKLYPDEWILLGNPEINNTTVMGGIVLYHSKDKTEVCYLGREKKAGYSSYTLAYTGEFKKRRTSGIMVRR